ncbi:hypothetical protein COBT_000799 [Conglomerata obtusa]
MIFLAVQLATKVHSIKCANIHIDLFDENLRSTDVVYDVDQPLNSTFSVSNHDNLFKNVNSCTEQSEKFEIKSDKISFEFVSTCCNSLNAQENFFGESFSDKLSLANVSKNHVESIDDDMASQNDAETSQIPFFSHTNDITNNVLPMFLSEKESIQPDLQLHVSENISDPNKHRVDLEKSNKSEYSQIDELLPNVNVLNNLNSIDEINQPKDVDALNISEINEWISEQPEFSFYNNDKDFIDFDIKDNPQNPVTDFDLSDGFLPYQNTDNPINDYKWISTQMNSYENNKDNIQNIYNRQHISTSVQTDYQVINTAHYYGPMYPTFFEKIEKNSYDYSNNDKNNASIFFIPPATYNMQNTILKNQKEIENEQEIMDANDSDIAETKVKPSCVNSQPLAISSKYTNEITETDLKLESGTTSVVDDVSKYEKLQSKIKAKSIIFFKNTDGNSICLKVANRDISKNKNIYNMVNKCKKNLITILEDIKLPRFKSFSESISQALDHIANIKTSSAIDKQSMNKDFTINAKNLGFEESNNDTSLAIEVGKNKPDANSYGSKFIPNVNYDNNGDTYTKNSNIVFSSQMEAHANFSDSINKNIKNAEKLMNEVHIDTNYVTNTFNLIKKTKKSAQHFKKRKINNISNYKNRKNDTGHIEYLENENLINAFKKSAESNNENQIDVTNNKNNQNCNVKISENTSNEKTATESWKIQLYNIQKKFVYNRTLLHHRKILVNMKHFAYKFLDKDRIYGENFINFLYTNIDALIFSALSFDEDYNEVFDNYEITNISIDANISLYKIDNINKDLYKALGELSKSERNFHVKLTAFVQNNYFDTNFTFNNLLFVICKNACKNDHIQIYYTKVSVIQSIIINILKSSSFETFIYYGEMCNLIDYLINLSVATLKIKDLGNYYAVLNVLSVVVKFKWFYTPIEQKTYNELNYFYIERLNNILENEKHRQNFFKILLYVIRPFVSRTRYLQAWHKNVTQYLDLKFITSRSAYHTRSHYKRFKLSFYACLDMFLWKDDFNANFYRPKCTHDQPDFYFFEYMLKQKHQKFFSKKLSSIALQYNIKQYLEIIQNKKEVNIFSFTDNPFLYNNFHLPLINILQTFRIADNNSFDKEITTVDVFSNENLIETHSSSEKLINLFLYKTILFNFVASGSNF